MELRKFIATTIREYLNEQASLENVKLNDNFRNWFGNSKVVDKDGNPMICYHGSNAKFSYFNYDKSLKSSGHKSEKIGFFFTNNFDIANSYSGRRITPYEDKPFSIVYSAFLKIENPIYIEYNKYYSLFEDENLKNELNKFLNEIKNHDGIIVGDFIEIVVFKSNQIKSVENDGTWDIGDENIYS